MKAADRLCSQSLRIARPPTCAKVSCVGIILQQPALADDLLFLREHGVHVFAGEAAVLHDDLGEDVLGLGQREAERGLDQPFAAGVVERDLDLLQREQIGDDLVQQRRQVVLRRQRIIEDGDLLLQLDGDLECRRDEDDRLEAVLQVQRHVAQLADGRGVGGLVALGEEGVEILEDENRRLDLLDDLVERGDGILGGGVAGFLALQVGAGRDQPG